MGMPVVVVASGGLPVTVANSGYGVPMTADTNGRGTPVTIVASGGMPVVGISGSVTPGSEATAFLARTSGLDATHTNAYTALINGLVADGVWTKLDVLQVYATQDATTAKLNLVSTSYTAVAVGALTFTADRGFNGPGTGNTIYLNTAFNPFAASSPHLVQNSAHVSAWSVTNIGTSSIPIMSATNGAVSIDGIHTKFTDNNVYFYANNGTGISVANATPTGHYVSNRSSGSNLDGYRNGSSIVSSSSSTSAAVPNLIIYVCGSNNGGTAFSSSHQVAMSSIGSSLSSTDVTNFYNRLRTYMTAVGVP